MYYMHILFDVMCTHIHTCRCAVSTMFIHESMACSMQIKCSHDTCMSVHTTYEYSQAQTKFHGYTCKRACTQNTYHVPCARTSCVLHACTQNVYVCRYTQCAPCVHTEAQWIPCTHTAHMTHAYLYIYNSCSVINMNACSMSPGYKHRCAHKGTPCTHTHTHRPSLWPPSRSWPIIPLRLQKVHSTNSPQPSPQWRVQAAQQHEESWKPGLSKRT